MDDVQYLEQDWNNRNRIKTANGPAWLTVPVSLKQSKSKLLRDIKVASDGWGSKRHWQKNHWKSLFHAYSKTPYWNDHAGWLEEFYQKKPWQYLSELNEVMLRYLLKVLDLDVEFINGSRYGFTGTKSDLVLDHCQKLRADVLIVGTLGRNYIEPQTFFDNGVSVHFQNYQHPEYDQRFNGFQPYMTVFDLIFNFGPDSFDILHGDNITRREIEEIVDNSYESLVIEGVEV
jgi:hypothetical protein